MKNQTAVIACLPLGVFVASPAVAQEDSTLAELVNQTQNPVAALVSIPLQFNYDRIGPAEQGGKWLLNVQPVIPFSIGQDWNLISRTIVPLVDQNGTLPGGAADVSGIGDITQTLIFTPKKPTASGWIWGAGLRFLLPTASDDLLGGEKWGIGPTAILLKQEHGWTYGVSASHIWSVAGNDQRQDISTTYPQLFLSYSTKTRTTFSISTDPAYDWKSEQWSVPINAGVSQVTKIGGQLMSVGGGVHYWADSPRNGPEGWGFRLQVSFLFPK